MPEGGAVTVGTATRHRAALAPTEPQLTKCQPLQPCVPRWSRGWGCRAGAGQGRAGHGLQEHPVCPSCAVRDLTMISFPLFIPFVCNFPLTPGGTQRAFHRGQSFVTLHSAPTLAMLAFSLCFTFGTWYIAKQEPAAETPLLSSAPSTTAPRSEAHFRSFEERAVQPYCTDRDLVIPSTSKDPVTPLSESPRAQAHVWNPGARIPYPHTQMNAGWK